MAMSLGGILSAALKGVGQGGLLYGKYMADKDLVETKAQVEGDRHERILNARDAVEQAKQTRAAEAYKSAVASLGDKFDLSTSKGMYAMAKALGETDPTQATQWHKQAVSMAARENDLAKMESIERWKMRQINGANATGLTKADTLAFNTAMKRVEHTAPSYDILDSEGKKVKSSLAGQFTTAFKDRVEALVAQNVPMAKAISQAESDISDISTKFGIAKNAGFKGSKGGVADPLELFVALRNNKFYPTESTAQPTPVEVKPEVAQPQTMPSQQRSVRYAGGGILDFGNASDLELDELSSDPSNPDYKRARAEQLRRYNQ